MADKIFEITVKDEHVTRALDANNSLDGKRVMIIVTSPDGCAGVSDYSADRLGGETNADYADRMAKKALFHKWRAAEDNTRKTDHRAGLAAVEMAPLDTPEEMIE